MRGLTEFHLNSEYHRTLIASRHRLFPGAVKMPYLSTGGLTIVTTFISIRASSLPSSVAIGLSIACVAAIVAALILEGSTSRVKHPKRNRERNLDT